jgi:hypothetical protein
MLNSIIELIPQEKRKQKEMNPNTTIKRELIDKENLKKNADRF